jgi:hypothetical protein
MRRAVVQFFNHSETNNLVRTSAYKQETYIVNNHNQASSMARSSSMPSPQTAAVNAKTVSPPVSNSNQGRNVQPQPVKQAPSPAHGANRGLVSSIENNSNFKAPLTTANQMAHQQLHSNHTINHQQLTNLNQQQLLQHQPSPKFRPLANQAPTPGPLNSKAGGSGNTYAGGQQPLSSNGAYNGNGAPLNNASAGNRPYIAIAGQNNTANRIGGNGMVSNGARGNNYKLALPAKSPNTYTPGMRTDMKITLPNSRPYTPLSTNGQNTDHSRNANGANGITITQKRPHHYENGSYGQVDKKPRETDDLPGF